MIFKFNFIILFLLSVQAIEERLFSQFYEAFSEGNKVVAKHLLDTNVDLSAENNWAIRWASRRGHADIVKLLLDSGKVDPTALDYQAVLWATLIIRQFFGLFRTLV